MDAMELIRAAVAAVDTDQKGRVAMVSPETELRALGLDSVSTIEMVGHVEDALGVTFDEEDLMKVTTLGDFARLIETRLPDAAGPKNAGSAKG